jgi:hypothetical protein
MDGTMQLDPDFSEFIECCIGNDVRFLVVGGYAVAAHGHPRYTKDLDVWIMIGPENAVNMVKALDQFGFGSLGLTPGDFSEPGMVIQLGYPPKRVDILTSVDGVDFEHCYRQRAVLPVEGIRTSVPFIGLTDLRRNKAASGRPQDLADLAALPPPEPEGDAPGRGALI